VFPTALKYYIFEAAEDGEDGEARLVKSGEYVPISETGQ